MPFSSLNDFSNGRRPMVQPSGAEVVAQRMTINLATGDLALNTTGQVGWLPPGCVPVDVQVDGTDMDTGAAAMVLQVGIGNAGVTDLSAAAADGGGAWGATVAAATAFVQRLAPTLNNMVNVQKSDVARPLCVKVQTAPTTPAAGTLGVTLFYRAA